MTEPECAIVSGNELFNAAVRLDCGPNMPDSILPLYRRTRPSWPVTARDNRVKLWSYSAALILICLTGLGALSTRQCLLPNSSCAEQDAVAKSAPRSLQALPEVSWSLLHGAAGERDAVLHVQNLCSSARHGVFQLQSAPAASPAIPEVNVKASAPELDQLWTPAKVTPSQLAKSSNFQYLTNTTLFVMGTIWAHHMSHFWVNNGFPLLDVMRTFYEDWDFNGSWLQQKRHLAVVNGRESLFEGIDTFAFEEVYDASSAKQAGASEGVTCYANAVIGLNSTCAHNFCKHEHADKGIYKFLRGLVWNHYLSASEAKQAQAIAAGSTKQKQHAVIVQRRSNRHMVNVDDMAKTFKQHGVSSEIVYLEDMSYRDQVRLFSLKATVIVGVHGNAVAHFLWSQPNTLVIEVFQLDWHSDWQELVVKQTWKAEAPHTMDIRYRKIECSDSSCSEGMAGLSANVKVNVSRLEEIIVTDVVPYI